jgi:NADH-quinone oxidoreductase subunit G
MVAIKALADKLGAPLSGFSDGYIKDGDGDGYLIQDDKSANRAGLRLLGIDCSKDGFEKAVREARLLINFDNDLLRGYGESELKKLLKDKKIIIAASHDDRLTAMADLAVPVATSSECAGSLINCDNIIQSSPAAVSKNHQPLDIGTLAAKLGSPLQSRTEQFAELRKYLSILKDFEADTLPAEGLKLTDSEAANVTA